MNSDKNSDGRVSDTEIIAVFLAGVGFGLMVYHFVFVEHLLWNW